MLKICLYKAVHHQRPVETFMEARMKKKGKGKKKEREKERETTNSIIPSKQSKKTLESTYIVGIFDITRIS